jgi:hypothetical protein
MYLLSKQSRSFLRAEMSAADYPTESRSNLTPDIVYTDRFSIPFNKLLWAQISLQRAPDEIKPDPLVNFSSLCGVLVKQE